MNISLTPELEKFIESKVKSGFYSSASEVVREGLRLLSDKEVTKDKDMLIKEVERGFFSAKNEPLLSAQQLEKYLDEVIANA